MVNCAKYSSGILRHEIGIERKIETDDGLGGIALSWANHFYKFASISHKSANERNHAGKLEAVKKTEIVIRWADDVLETDRINYNGRLFQIRGIINLDELDQWLVMTCEEGVAQ